MTLCAVIPAAGRGSRLQADRPKMLVEITSRLTIWDIITQNLSTIVDEFDIIVSPDGKALFEEALSEHPPGKKVTFSLQRSPRGMGDAIFCGIDQWGKSDNILIIWGDQVHVSQETLQSCVAAHRKIPGSHITIPTVRLAEPYVEFVFSGAGKLTKIKQSREGDICTPNGWGDLGTFLLTTDGLEQAWQEFLATTPRGAQTGEINFLPFLIFLSQNKDWTVTQIPIQNPDEARGINTREDLEFFKKLYFA